VKKNLRNKDKGKILAVLLSVMLILAFIPVGIAGAAPAALTIIPNGGPITTSATVGINATPSGGQAVYYTINSGTAGTIPTLTPTVNCTVYSHPFIVSTSVGTFTVDAAVYDPTIGWGTLATAMFTVTPAPVVNLGTAASFAVLAGAGIMNTGTVSDPTTITGDVGTYPTTTETGFTGGDLLLTGTNYEEAGDLDNTVTIAAQAALLIAYNDAVGLASTKTLGDGEDLGGQTLYPGVYTSASTLKITSGSLTLDAQGDPNAVFVFQMGSALTTAASGAGGSGNGNVILTDGAQASNIFWQVYSGATLGTYSTFYGTILGDTGAITVGTGATVNGRLLTMTGAVTLGANTINAPVLALTTTPTAAAGSTNGTTAVTASPNTSGDTLAVEVSSTSITTPNVGAAAPTGTGVTNPYTPGSSISGVAGDYVGVYELNSSGTVVAFSQIQLTSGDIYSTTGVPAAPTIIQDGGVITTTQTVGIGNITAGDTAYYTISSGTTGPSPTVSSTVYTIPFTVSAAAGIFTVDAAVYDNVFGWSPVTPATFDVSYPASSGGGGGGGSIVSDTPTVTSEAATSVTSTSAVLNGDITSENGSAITAYGFLWGTSSTSLTNTLAVGANNFTGVFTDTLSGLTDGTTYYFEAYATNAYGTGDGSVLSLTAGVTTPTPTVMTEAASSITTDSAVLNGDITSDSGYSITDCGFLWGTSSSSLTTTLDVGANTQSGAFMDTLSGLTTGTTYYFEAYATNSYGTADGTVMSFTAGVQPPTTTTPSTGIAFSDVSARFWGYNIITSLATRGIVAGYPDGTFKPNAAITRAEFATMLVKALGLSITGTTTAFTDVAQGSWDYGSVNAAAAAGLVTGYGGTTQFGPYTLITREQMAVMVAKGMGSKAPATNGTELNAFNDGSRVSSWATTGVDEAVKAGIVIGMSADHLAPLAHATRAQAAAMIYQLLAFLGQ
jgi:hypothetical protein